MMQNMPGQNTWILFVYHLLIRRAVPREEAVVLRWQGQCFLQFMQQVLPTRLSWQFLSKDASEVLHATDCQ